MADASVPVSLAGRSRSRIDVLLRRLDAREYRVLELLVGLDGRGPRTPVRVGAQLGLGQDKVQELFREALRRLRSMRGSAAGAA